MKNYVKIALSVSIGILSFSAGAEEGWKSESQAGLVLVTGNTETTTVSAAQSTAYEFEMNILKLSAGYLYQKSGDVLSAKAWNLGLRYDRKLSDRQSIFIGQSVEGDLFKGIKQRYNTDIGTKYIFTKTEDFSWFGELGYRFTRENSLFQHRNLHYARAYTELERKLNAAVSAKYWFEFLPNFTETSDWQANTELSLSALLNSVFSVKSAYLLKFDKQINAPGLVKTDKVFTTSLVAKF